MFLVERSPVKEINFEIVLEINFTGVVIRVERGKICCANVGKKHDSCGRGKKHSDSSSHDGIYLHSGKNSADNFATRRDLWGEMSMGRMMRFRTGFWVSHGISHGSLGFCI